MKNNYNLTAATVTVAKSIWTVLRSILAVLLVLIISQAETRAMFAKTGTDLPVKVYVLEGVVLDETGSPLPGVNIVLNDTNYGTSTDLDGEFKFPTKVKAGDVLSFSFIGYETKTYVVQDQKSPNIWVEMKMDQFVILGELSVSEVHNSSEKSGFWATIRSWFN